MYLAVCSDTDFQRTTAFPDLTVIQPQEQSRSTTTTTTKRFDTDETRQCDSLLGKRRGFTSRGEKQKPCGMTLPQLELWDKGR